MDGFDLLQFIHIAAAIVWVGGGFLAGVFAARLKAAEPQHRLGFARMMRFVSVGVLTPAAVIVLAMGVWMVLDTDIYDFEQTWIVIGIAVVAISVVTGIAFLKPTIEKGLAAMEAGDAATAGSLMRRLGLGSRVLLVLQVVAIWAMVAKPGL